MEKGEREGSRTAGKVGWTGRGTCVNVDTEGQGKGTLGGGVVCPAIWGGSQVHNHLVTSRICLLVSEQAQNPTRLRVIFACRGT